MPRILLSSLVVLGSAAAIAAGATGAFFSDTETSTGNTFAAGTLDLKIDNESYYNLNKCAVDAQDIDQDQNTTEYVWQGQAGYPVPGTDCSTSFPASDLGQGLLFFNFTDVKPDDEGEDTISIHVQNDAYACLDMTLTSDDDNSTTEPEGIVDPVAVDAINDTWDGELADTIQMFWWADDGDNVYEVGENDITDGVQSITTMFGEDKLFSAALADSNENIWNPNDLTPDPVPANQTVYIAKAWCMGTLAPTPLADDADTGPQVRGTGFTCNGAALGNETQTDSLTLDVAFRAEQARHNPNFQCGEEETRTATLTVVKIVTNDNGGNNVVADFQLFADNGTTEIPMTSGISNVVPATSYTITETGISGYVASFSGDCNSSGQITLLPGENKTCTITNNDLPANITLIKNVVNNGPGTPGTATSNSAWGLRIDGNIVPNNTSVAVTANTPHTINEDGRAGYTFTGITGPAECPAVLGGTATLDEGEAITCTITNDDNGTI